MNDKKQKIPKTTVGAVLKAYALGKIALLPGDIAGLKKMPKSMEVFGFDFETAALEADSIRRGAPANATADQILSAWGKL